MDNTIKEKVFVSEISASEFVPVKLLLLKREYLSSAVNVLTNKVKIFHVTKTDPIELNHVHSDQ